MFPQRHWKQKFHEGSFCHLFSISLLCPNLALCSSQLLSPSLFQRTPDGFDSVPLKTSSGGPDMDLWEALTCLLCLLTLAQHLASLWRFGCSFLQYPLLKISSLWPYQKKFEFQIFGFFIYIYKVPELPFLLASNLPNIPILCLYNTPLLASCFPNRSSRRSHSFICS